MSAVAHRGFNKLTWQEDIGPYKITVLEDFHLTQDKEQAKLIVQVLHETKTLPANTQVLLKLSFANKVIYQGDIPFIKNGTSDGKTFYSTYALSIAANELGTYKLNLTIIGLQGESSKEFLIENQQNSPFWLELLPSLLILLIGIASLAILFVPHRIIRRKD